MSQVFAGPCLILKQTLGERLSASRLVANEGIRGRAQTFSSRLHLSTRNLEVPVLCFRNEFVTDAGHGFNVVRDVAQLFS